MTNALFVAIGSTEFKPPIAGIDGENVISAIEADTVVCALGFRSPYAQVNALCEECDDSFIIGDCRNVAMIYQAIDAGYYAARSL